MKKAVILVSGGMDSAVVLAIAREQGFAVHALSVSYGQRPTPELDAAVRVARDIGALEHQTVNVDLRSIGGSARTPHIEGSLDSDQDADAPELPGTTVSARKTINLSGARG